MSTTYRVDVDGTTVWSTETDTYDGLAVFPAEYLARPTSGEVRLFVNGELAGRQISHDDELAESATAQKTEG